MAKKRLNKKVALIGSAVFMVLVLGAAGVILHLSRDPEKFVKDGDEALKAANQAIDEKIKKQQYDRAERCYFKARGLAKTDSRRVEILFKLVDMYIETDQWRKVPNCWNKIISIDPKNVKARYGRLKYFYIIADSGARGLWRELASQASEFIEIAEDADLLAEDMARWETFEIQKRKGAERLGPYLYLLRGRATFEMAKLGEVTDPDESLVRAMDDFKKVRELEPNNVDACLYLAEAVKAKGEILASRGSLEERDKAAEQAGEFLQQAVEVAGDDPRAHINLLMDKLTQISATGLSEEQIQSLEPDYLSLVEKFSSSAQAYSALAAFYQLAGHKDFDKAIEAVGKAIELDNNNVVYAINAANLHYRKFSIWGQKQEIYKAIEVAKNALTLPDAQDKPDPRHPRYWANRMNRLSLYGFLANCYIEQVLEPCEVSIEARKQQWLTDAEQAVHEIEQLLGSGVDPQVIKWQGMLELARGNRDIAIRKLYEAYERIKASKPPDQRDAQLSYALAKVFQDTAEIGAVREFLESALNAGIGWTKPAAYLDYAEVLLKLSFWAGVISNTNGFEEIFGPDERSQTLRIKAYIGANQFDDAQQELAKRKSEDPDTIKLSLELVQAKIGRWRRAITQEKIKEGSRIIFEPNETQEKEDVKSRDSVQLMTVELNGYRKLAGELVEKLLSIEPNSVGETSVVAICNEYIAQGQTEQAKGIVNKLLEYFPDNTTVLFYKQLLSEPQPDRITQQRRREIQRQVLSNITDPVRRAMSLGSFYQSYNEPDKAAEEFKKVVKIEALQEDVVEEPAFEKTEETIELRRLAANYLFDIALRIKDLQLAEQVAEVGRRENLDDCQGLFFAARLAAAKEQYNDALARLDECLKQRPVFSRGFALRSTTHAALGNEHASIEDARKAASINLLDGLVAKVLANVLYRRNEKLGDNVSSDQLIETRNAFHKAVALNPGDLQLLSFYAEYISSENPDYALSIRQRLQKAAPSVQNAVLLGRMATKMAVKETHAGRKEALFAIALSSFEQAIAIEPQNRAARDSFAEYYRLTGQEGKAEEVLKQDRKLLWRHYFRSGQFEDAREVLQRLYKTEAKDSDVLKGLLLVAEKAVDQEAVKKYSQELLLLEDSVENRLIQIQTFLKIGLTREARYKLQSFKEKYADEPRALLLEAWLTMRQGQLKNALELTNRSLQSNQNNATAWRLRGQVNLLMADYQQAISDLKGSKSLSDEPVTRIALAKAYRRAGRAEDAITELKNTIDHPQAPAEARTLLEQIYLQLGRKEALRRFYDETLKKFPDNVLWYNQAAEFAIAEGEFDRAEQLYLLVWQKAKKDSKAGTAALDGYLQALLLAGKLDKVFEEGAKYVSGDFAPIAYLRMAEAKLKLGDKAIAAKYAREALEKAFAGTNEGFASNILQRVYLLLGAQEVVEYCSRILKDDPDSLTVNFAMFNLTKINGQYNKAVGYIDKCLQIMGPDNPNRVHYIVQKTSVLQLAYNKTSDNNYLNGAIAEYESLLSEMPNNTNILNNLAYMLAENDERLTDALTFAKRALEARPNNPGYLDTYAYVLYKNGKNAEADEFLQASLQQYEARRLGIPAEVYEHLGMIKEELGAKDKALAAYKQALETGTDESPKAVRQRLESAIERLSQ